MKLRSPQVLVALLLIGSGVCLSWRARHERPNSTAPKSDAPRAEWPEFRGPTEDGHSTATGLPTEWGPDKDVVWKTPLPGRAWSSPIVAGDRIYLTNAVTPHEEEDLHASVTLHALALGATDGKVLWDRELFTIEQPYTTGFNDKNSHASPTPVYDQGRIYAQFGNFGTACLDEQGHVIWKTQEPTFKTELGNGGCPIVVDDLLVFNCDGVVEPFVVALDKATGKERWRTVRGRKAKNVYALSTPLLIDADGKKQIITVGTRIIQSVNPKNGHEFWHVDHGNYCTVPRPVFGDGLVFVSTGFDHSNLFAIKPEGKGNITGKNLVWQYDKNVPLTSSMLVVGDDLYMVSDNGLVTCMEARTGQVYWQERVARSTSASPLYGDGKIYIQDETGKGYVLKPGHQKEVIATNDLGERTMSSYAVHGNKFIIRSLHAVWCIGVK